jgi:hypothetical protein
MSALTVYPPLDMAAVDAAGDCVVCGRPAAHPYRRSVAGIVTEGCVARAHLEAGVADGWMLAARIDQAAGRLYRGESAGAIHADVVALSTWLEEVDVRRDARNIGSRLAYCAGRSITAGAGRLSKRSYTIALRNLAHELRDLPVSS